jgi:hypothetical protein
MRHSPPDCNWNDGIVMQIRVMALHLGTSGRSPNCIRKNEILVHMLQVKCIELGD